MISNPASTLIAIVMVLSPQSSAADEVLLLCTGIEVVTDRENSTWCNRSVCERQAYMSVLLRNGDLINFRTGRVIVPKADGPEAVNKRGVSEREIDLLSIRFLERLNENRKIERVPVQRHSAYLNRITGEFSAFWWSDLSGSTEFSGLCDPVDLTPKF